MNILWRYQSFEYLISLSLCFRHKLRFIRNRDCTTAPMRVSAILAPAYNQPIFSQNASWDSNGITVLDASQLPHGLTQIFVNKNNTWYTASDGYNDVVSGISFSVNPSVLASGGFCLFVSTNDDIYICDQDKYQVTRWSMNGAINDPAMFFIDHCRGLFMSSNNTLYCSFTDTHQVVTRSLDEPTNKQTIVAGTGCPGQSSTELHNPTGIFVNQNSSLYIADSYNHRIQLFRLGQVNATTVAGTGAPGTINLSYPMDVTLDGDGYLFVVDKDNHRIVGSGPDGFRCAAGCSGVSGSASNQLLYPQSMSFDSHGNIWVADSNNQRIQKFVLKTNSCGEHHSMLSKNNSVQNRIEYDFPLALLGHLGISGSNQSISYCYLSICFYIGNTHENDFHIASLVIITF